MSTTTGWLPATSHRRTWAAGGSKLSSTTAIRPTGPLRTTIKVPDCVAMIGDLLGVQAANSSSWGRSRGTIFRDAGLGKHVDHGAGRNLCR